MGAKLLKKITTKDVCGKIVGDLFARVVAAKGAVIDLMEIVGIARKAKPDASAMGEYIKFIGVFKATNLLTGEQYQSGACILPGAMPDMIYGALDGEGVQEAQFAFRVGVMYDDTAIAKYVYTCESLLEPGKSDPLALLESQVKRSPALPAPPAEPEPAPASTEAPATEKKGKATK